MVNPPAYRGSVYVTGWNDTLTPWTASSVAVRRGNDDGFVDYVEIQKIYS